MTKLDNRMRHSATILLRTINPFTPTDRFSGVQTKESKSPIKLLSVVWVKSLGHTKILLNIPV